MTGSAWKEGFDVKKERVCQNCKAVLPLEFFRRKDGGLELTRTCLNCRKCKAAYKGKKLQERGPPPKRQPTAWNLFVKEMMSTEEIRALPPTDRLAVIGKMWRDK
jgi:hypothetical protein